MTSAVDPRQLACFSALLALSDSLTLSHDETTHELPPRVHIKNRSGRSMADRLTIATPVAGPKNEKMPPPENKTARLLFAALSAGAGTGLLAGDGYEDPDPVLGVGAIDAPTVGVGIGAGAAGAGTGAGLYAEEDPFVLGSFRRPPPAGARESSDSWYASAFDAKIMLR
mmetsp:Transcript_17978/g.44864  ORF Transcript_17978/g.44864 Transcript_17978/m.44864 type:complete len:169 (-) Transcript_17978:260-766(-)